jgi:hypothetical protein
MHRRGWNSEIRMRCHDQLRIAVRVLQRFECEAEFCAGKALKFKLDAGGGGFVTAHGIIQAQKSHLPASFLGNAREHGGCVQPGRLNSANRQETREKADNHNVATEYCPMTQVDAKQKAGRDILTVGNPGPTAKAGACYGIRGHP